MKFSYYLISTLLFAQRSCARTRKAPIAGSKASAIMPSTRPTAPSTSSVCTLNSSPRAPIIPLAPFVPFAQIASFMTAFSAVATAPAFFPPQFYPTQMVPYRMYYPRYHYPIAIRNIVKSYSKEKGHFSETAIVSHHHPYQIFGSSSNRPLVRAAVSLRPMTKRTRPQNKQKVLARRGSQTRRIVREKTN